MGFSNGALSSNAVKVETGDKAKAKEEARRFFFDCRQSFSY